MIEKWHTARWWKRGGDGRIECLLCPRHCRIPEGSHGFCFIRANRAGALISKGYGRPSGFAVDPIEKKPLSHFYPGTTALSFGTVGCNLACRFCQNWSISAARTQSDAIAEVSPESVVALAKKLGCESIAYTYNDPTIWSEFAVDVSRLARNEGLRNVFVTAGYITPEARVDVMKYMDAVNVDLKSFSERFYVKLTAGHIEPVKDTIRWLVKETTVWTEITTLLIAGENDSDAEIHAECSWIAQELGPEVPLHFTAFYPAHKMREHPATPPETLLRAREIAFGHGLRYVYTGNILDPDFQSTRCPTCSAVLIRRSWHTVQSYDLDGDCCRFCRTKIAGRFAGTPPAALARGHTSAKRIAPDLRNLPS